MSRLKSPGFFGGQRSDLWDPSLVGMEQTWLCSPGEVACGAWGPLQLLLCQQSADTCQAATLAGSGQSQSLELGTGDAWEPGPLWPLVSCGPHSVPKCKTIVPIYS